MKMKGPDNTGGLSVDGKSYEPDEDGCVVIDAEHVVHAVSHGFVAVFERVPAAPPAPADDVVMNLLKLNKKQLLAFGKDVFGLDLDEAKTNKELIAEIEAAKAATATQTTQDGEQKATKSPEDTSVAG